MHSRWSVPNLLPYGTRGLLVLVLAFVVAYGELSRAGAEVLPLDQPNIDERADAMGIDMEEGFRFVAFGDQKTMWGEGKGFQRLLRFVAVMDSIGTAPLFMLDTGDIIGDGYGNPEQFGVLAEYLHSEVPDISYLVAVGNHELGNTNKEARKRTSTFLGNVVNDSQFNKDRLYYSKRIGPVQFLFLNSNDFVYPGDGVEDRRDAQILWLKEELAKKAPTTVVALHHPFIQSAKKHFSDAADIWNTPTQDGSTLPEILIKSGVDLVLVGHIHSWESFRLEREGKTMWVVNSSGKPNGWRERYFQHLRITHDWRGKEFEKLKDEGFQRLDGWEITQLGFMEKQENQISVIDVKEDGSLHVEVLALDGRILNEIKIPFKETTESGPH